MLSAHRGWLISGLISIVALALFVSPLQAGKTIRWKLKAGDSFDVEMNQSSVQVVNVGDMMIEVPNSMIMYMTWNVEKVEDGIAHVTQTIKRIKMTSKPPMGAEVVYDSTDTKEPEGQAKQIADLMKPLVGVKFTQQMNDQGKIIDLTIPKELIESVKGNPVAKQYFEDGGFKTMIQQSSMVLPAEAMEKGHSWNSKSENKTPIGKMILDSKYTYDGEQKTAGGATLDKFDVSVTVELEAGAGILGAKVTITEQESSGRQLFDTEAGHLTEGKVDQKLTMQISVAGNVINQQMKTATVLTMKPASKSDSK